MIQPHRVLDDLRRVAEAAVWVRSRPVCQTIEAVADVADQDILLNAAEEYSVMRRFSLCFRLRLLESFQFQSNVPYDPVLASIEAIKAADQAGACRNGRQPAEAPCHITYRWKSWSGKLSALGTLMTTIAWFIA